MSGEGVPGITLTPLSHHTRSLPAGSGLAPLVTLVSDRQTSLLVVLTESGRLLMLNARDGAVVWRHQLPLQ